MKRVLKEIYYFIYEFIVSIRRHCCRNKKIEKLRDTHSGERCFIVCTGPSLTIEDLNLIKNEFTFSMNSIINLFDKTEYRPDVYMLQDPFVYQKISDRVFEEIKNIKIKLFGSIVKYKFQTLKLPSDIMVYNLSLLGHNMGRNKNIKFSDDFSRISYDGFSVTYSAVQLAVYMGFKDIYFIGNDCNYSTKKKHFDGYADDGNYDNTAENMLRAYEYLHSMESKLGVNIYNSTRGGSLDIFTRVPLEDIFAR
ncbi:MAG: DUF115 domain-containing protein [Ruminococcus sp.]|nr:DUF115 domain-containing protein [Ruminococcus sp.]